MEENRVYINGIGSISAQPEDAVFEGKVARYHQNIIPAIAPDYKEFIKPMMLRRMSKAVKMGVTAARIALRDAGIENPEAIITGTGEGCKQDTENFLEKILETNEGLLTPTAFIQSTHNTVAGQIALNLRCTGYNMTYTQNSVSLESAFIDAQMQMGENAEMKSVLVGGIEEIATKTTALSYLDGQLKQGEIANMDLLKSNTKGTITSEGAHFFSLSTERNKASYAHLRDISFYNSVRKEEVEQLIEDFLAVNKMNLKDIDAVVLGNNGDSRFDNYYTHLQQGIFKTALQLAYKPLVGDYNTVSGYAVCLACKILKHEYVPGILKMNNVKPNAIKNILIYNQYLGKNHSLILLSAV